jgi:hypothetical protein
MRLEARLWHLSKRYLGWAFIRNLLFDAKSGIQYRLGLWRWAMGKPEVIEHAW